LLHQGRETSLVEWILKKFRLQDLKPELRQAYYDLFGWVEYSQYADCTMPFATLDAVLPGFPVRLLSRHLEWDERRRQTLIELFTGPTSLDVYEYWLREREDKANQDGRPVGLCYNFGESLPYGLIVHDYTDASLVVPARGRMVIEDGPRVAIIEPFRNLIGYLAKIPWTLEQFRSQWEPPRQKQLPEMDLGHLQTWQLARLNRRLHDKCAFQVLALLLDLLLTSDAIRGQHPATKYYDGRRWVLTTQKRMANEVGVSPATVARAVKSLKERGLLLIRPTKSGDCSYAEYSVDLGRIQELLEA